MADLQQKTGVFQGFKVFDNSADDKADRLVINFMVDGEQMRFSTPCGSRASEGGQTRFKRAVQALGASPANIPPGTEFPVAVGWNDYNECPEVSFINKPKAAVPAELQALFAEALAE